MESKLQSKFIKYLKAKGCYVIKTTPGPGVPTGCLDVFFIKEGFWGAVEIKSSEKAAWRPLQKETLEKLAAWSWAKKVYPENYEETIAELDKIL